ncbi:hypothetical protein DPMN_036570 [Dreissena polymorpha]|uniref:Adenosine kinase n=1 Tax=Dreissena polymorpha TaxID=45954 RepID=A0A9D4M9D5_DREPO|nr:hypothetical protein DPMN_036570 [Dreissena polymorpha]
MDPKFQRRKICQRLTNLTTCNPDLSLPYLQIRTSILRRFRPEPVYIYGSASAGTQIKVQKNATKNLSLVYSASALRLPPDRRLSSPILGGGDLAVPDTMAQRKPQWPPMSQLCGKVQEFPVIKIKAEDIVDTNGAGDAFVGGFLA